MRPVPERRGGSDPINLLKCARKGREDVSPPPTNCRCSRSARRACSIHPSIHPRLELARDTRTRGGNGEWSSPHSGIRGSSAGLQSFLSAGRWGTRRGSRLLAEEKKWEERKGREKKRRSVRDTEGIWKRERGGRKGENRAHVRSPQAQRVKGRDANGKTSVENAREGG